ncbi:UNVERIFIED_CONTAM: hypothetical protein FKN15_062088 [Acipenser sinensis]
MKTSTCVLRNKCKPTMEDHTVLNCVQTGLQTPGQPQGLLVCFSVHLVELTVPWEEFVDEAYERKNLWYAELAAEVEQLWWKLDLSSRVSVHLVELTVPWEEFVDEAYERKNLWYAELAAEVEQLWWKLDLSSRDCDVSSSVIITVEVTGYWKCSGVNANAS